MTKRGTARVRTRFHYGCTICGGKPSRRLNTKRERRAFERLWRRQVREEVQP